jgi:hypothetical protein
MSIRLEEFWGDVLSEEPLRVLAAWGLLDAEKRAAVRAHLTKMASADGWAEAQRRAAQAALNALADENEGNLGEDAE